LRTATSWFGFPWRNSRTSPSPPASPRPRPWWPPPCRRTPRATGP